MAASGVISEAVDQMAEVLGQPQEVPQNGNQFDSARGETEQKRENSTTGVNFSRLDPSRRSLSSPNIPQTRLQQQQQTSQPQNSLHDAIKRKLKRQLRPNSLVYFKIGATNNSTSDSAPSSQHQSQPQTETAAGAKRRRTALGLISSASNRPIGSAASGCTGSGASGWRNWFLSSSSSSNAARSQQEGVKRAIALELGREERHLESSSTPASSNCAGQERPPGSSWPGEGSAGPKRSAQASNRLHSSGDLSSSQRTKTQLNIDLNGDLSSVVSICMGPDETNRKLQNREQAKWQTSSATGPKTNVILIQHKQTVTQQKQASSQTPVPNSPTTSNSLELVSNYSTGPKSSTASEMITSGGGGTAACPAVRPSLVDMLIDSQLDWRRLISEANEGLRLGDHLGALQIKRQEIIHELIQTERHHCLTLALMRQVYLTGLLKLNEHRQRDSQPANCYAGQSGQTSAESGALNQQQAVNSSAEPIDIERLFPALEELIQAHELFFAHLRLRLVDCCSRDRLARHMPLVGIVGPLGDLLIDQFKLQAQPQTEATSQQDSNQTGPGSIELPHHRPKSGRRHQQQRRQRDSASGSSRNKPANNTNGQKLLQAYAKFCGQHYESSRYFKQLMQHDKGFKQFIEHCNKQHAACRQRGIPECNLLVAQRLTKYPLLIEQLIKASKDEPNGEEEKLKQALCECRALLAELNSQLARKESFERLLDIYAQFSPKSYTIFNHKSAIKFTKHDLLQHKRLRQLLHADDQVRIFNATRQKLFPVLCLILDDIVVFLRVEHSNSHNHQINLPAQQAVLAGARAVGVAQLAPEMVQQQAGSFNHHAHLTSLGAANESLSQTLASTTPTTTIASSHQAQLQQQQQQQQQQSAYYFANIDNKSSVISLSNLIVREKAVVDPEPRSYLISNSLEQPEMYEVAFTSRRHQTNFVEKLKSAIEQHIKHKLSADHYHHHHRRRRSRLVAASSCCSLATSSTNTCSLSDSSVGSLFESCDSSSSSSSSGRAPSLNSSSDNDREEDEEEERPVIEATNLSGQAKLTQQVALAPLAIETGKTKIDKNNSLKRANSMRRSKQLPQTQLATGAKLAGGKLDELAEDLDNLALDIEQEILPEPARFSSAASPPVSPSRELHDDNGSEDQSSQVLSESAPPGGKTPDTPPSPQAKSPSPDEPVVGTGLSGRARDSCDDLSSPRLYQMGGGPIKASKNHRRRRFQRPRQVSNQSSDSGATSGTSLTSGLGTTTGDEATPTASEISADNGEKSSCNEGNRHEEDHDSGRGHDDSSSSGSCNDSITLTRGDKLVQPNETSESLSSRSTNQQASRQVIGETFPEVAPSSSEVVVAEAKKNTASASQTALNQEAAGSKRQLLKQQRKLSTVSTISNQKRLMQTLRSVGLLTSSGQSQHQNQPNQQDQIALCQNCSIKFHKSHQLEPNQPFDQQTELGGFVLAANATKRYRQQLRRRSFFDPEQKLEEIRDSRIQLDKDKLEWREKFSRQQEQLLDERRELDLAREQLKRERAQVEIERQQLYRKLDILKENGILLSPSHKVIITAPSNTNPQQLHYQSPSVVVPSQQQTQQQALYATYGNLLQPQPVANGAKVPMHLSQESTQLSSQQTGSTSQLHQQRSSLIGALPGASFLVRRFGGGNYSPPAAASFSSGNPSQSGPMSPPQHQLDRAAL